MPPKLYKAPEVCDMTELQPYVLRSWEKEFPGIGVQKSSDGPRLYRDADVEQVRRIKHLVFGEGQTLAGARRRLDDAGAFAVTAAAEAEVAEVIEALGSDARTRIASVREGLQAILDILSRAPGPVVVVSEEYQLRPPAPAAPAASSARRAAARPKPRVVAKQPASRGKAVARKAPPARRKRASA
jgi:DNA-binding transcriptional MerR regulator